MSKTVTDQEILEWYNKGWHDECKGTSTTESDQEILNFSYRSGAHMYIVGDEVSSADLKTNEDIVKMVRKDFKMHEEYVAMVQADVESDAKKYKETMEFLEKEMGAEWVKEMKEYLEEEDCYYNPDIVDEPKGRKQEVDGYELIKEEWVDQWRNGGYTGDDFAGNIYFKLNNGKYITWEYSM